MTLARKMIRITADMSPNVRLAKAQIAAGQPVTNEILVPGILTWEEYCERRKWPKTSQMISLDAQFPEDVGLLLFPPDWLKNSEALFKRYGETMRKRTAKALGCDPGEGSANTAVAVVDEYGLLDLVSFQTPDTNKIPGLVAGIGRKWQVPADKWMFDRGGGGKQHADRLRAMGLPVQTVAFGEPVLLDIKRGLTLMEERREQREQRYVYKNRRSEMYGTLSDLCDPGNQRAGYAIPGPDTGPAFERLRKQLAPIPISYDGGGEGKLCLPPKAEMIATLYGGEFSPDEADALVLAVYGLTHKSRRVTAGAS